MSDLLNLISHHLADADAESLVAIIAYRPRTSDEARLQQEYTFLFGSGLEADEIKARLGIE
jgi:hypothetical protein